MTANIQTLAQLLDTSLIPSQNKQGREPLQSGVVAGLSAAIQSLNKLIPPRSERELTDNFCVAEISLRASENQEGFAPLLLQIVASDNFALNTRLAAALYFKNLLGRNWTVGSPGL